HLHLHSSPTRRSSDLTSPDAAWIPVFPRIVVTTSVRRPDKVIHSRDFAPTCRLPVRIRFASGVSSSSTNTVVESTKLCATLVAKDRKSTRLNSSHVKI